MLYRTRTRLILVLLLTLSLSGCLFRSHKVQMRMSTAALQTATREQLVDIVNSEAARIQTLDATVDMDASVGGSVKGKITEYQEIRGYILVRQPEMLRMIGLYPIVRNRAFDMVSDGESFKLFLPSKNQFIIGKNEMSQRSTKPLENLRPQHIYDALLLRHIDPETEIAVLEHGTEEVVDPKTRKMAIQPDYVLDVISRDDHHWYLERKITFSRIDLEPERQVIYDKFGYVTSDVHYQNLQDYGETRFPSLITIWRPIEEYSVTIAMVKLTFNKPLTDEQFVLAQPAGSQLLDLDKPHNGNGGSTQPR